MLIKLLKWFKGYLKVRIKGYSPERFINLCSNKDILIWNLKKVDDEFEFYITVKGFKSIKDIVRKTKTRPYIIKRIGLPFQLKRYKKKKTFFFGIIICCFFIYSLSLFIWDINISGGYTYTPETLLKYLQANNIYSGILKNNLDCSMIEDSIRKEYNDIGWVSAEVKGTRLIIKIVETNMPQKAITRTEPCHIVASKDGIIVSIITRSGTPLVSVGDVVKKGDRLVSGVISIVGDNEIVIEKKPVVSDADILMKCIYEYHNEINLTYTEKVYTGKNKYSFSLFVFNKIIKLYNPFKKYGKYDIIKSENNFVIGNNFFLPIGYMTTNYKEYKEIDNKYTKTQVTEIAQKELNRYLKGLKENGVSVLENRVKIEINNKLAKVFGKIIVNESSVNYTSIDDEEWKDIETDEID